MKVDIVRSGDGAVDGLLITPESSFELGVLKSLYPCGASISAFLKTGMDNGDVIGLKIPMAKLEKVYSSSQV
jgi:hypothetical protein